MRGAQSAVLLAGASADANARGGEQILATDGAIRDETRAVLLCGGSGAELIGMVHAISSIIGVARNASSRRPQDQQHKQHEQHEAQAQAPLFTLHVTVVDHVEEWRPGIQHYAHALQQRSGIASH